MVAGNYSITIPMQDMNKKIRVTQTVARRGESGATVKVHVHRCSNKRRWSRWSRKLVNTYRKTRS